MLHHGSIRKYTAALLDFFNNVEIQYNLSDGQTLNRDVPIKYSSREKLRELDEYTTSQLLEGNYNVLPRGNIALSAMNKSEVRSANKNVKINKFKSDETMEYSWNSVPYEFSFDISYMCRGMNEATQIIEQIAPKFNPTVNIDVWDASNLNEATRVPVKLLDISLETEEYEELSSNIVTVVFSLSLTGNLYPPIKSQPRIKEFQAYFNQLTEDNAICSSMFEWDVDQHGHIIPDSLDRYDVSNGFLINDGTGGGSTGGCTPVDLSNLPITLITIEKTQITNNMINLPSMAIGDIVHNSAMIWDEMESPWFVEVSCNVSENQLNVLFDPLDDLNGKFCVLTYLGLKIN